MKFIDITFKFKVNAPCKFKIDSFKANWREIKLYPRLWVDKADSPLFRYKSIQIRFIWWTYRIQKLNTND